MITRNRSTARSAVPTRHVIAAVITDVTAAQSQCYSCYDGLAACSVGELFLSRSRRRECRRPSSVPSGAAWESRGP